MSPAKSILRIFSLRKCGMAPIFAAFATRLCRGCLTSSINLSWQCITVVTRFLHRHLRLLALFWPQGLFLISLLLLLLPSATLFQLYPTSLVLVANFSAIFMDLFLPVSYSIGFLGVLGSFSFSPFCGFHPDSVWTPLFFLGGASSLVDARLGGVWSVLDPRVE